MAGPSAQVDGLGAEAHCDRLRRRGGGPVLPMWWHCESLEALTGSSLAGTPDFSPSVASGAAHSAPLSTAGSSGTHFPCTLHYNCSSRGWHKLLLRLLRLRWQRRTSSGVARQFPADGVPAPCVAGPLRSAPALPSKRRHPTSLRGRSAPRAKLRMWAYIRYTARLAAWLCSGIESQSAISQPAS